MKIVIFSDVSAMRSIPVEKTDGFVITRHRGLIRSFLDSQPEVHLAMLATDESKLKSTTKSYPLLSNRAHGLTEKYYLDSWVRLTEEELLELDSDTHYIAIEGGKQFILFTPKSQEEIDYKERFEKLQMLTTQFFKAAGSYSSAIEIDSHVTGYISGDEFEKQIRELLNLPSVES